MGNETIQLSIRELLQKFDRPGPRYTSYPTAPIFSHEFGAGHYADEIARSNAAENSADLSLYVHFPFCDTLCYFCGCTTMITGNRDRIAEYLTYLRKEIDLLSSRIAPGRRVAQMHWGGGTPTYLSPLQITEIAEYLRARFTFAPDAEVSVEVDPRDLTFDHMKALRDGGFNRVSLGVQDFDPSVQQAINRIQPEEVTRRAVTWARTLGFASLNVDLIYGLPHQSPESFGETLDKIIEIAPNRIAVYNFAYVPWLKPHQKLIRQEDLPSPADKLSILTMTIEKLTSAGYVYIGMDHFARTDDELARAQRERTLQRNFEGYSTRAGCDLFGLGMSSISHFGTTYAQNAKTLPAYYAAVGAGKFATEVGYRMTTDDELRKYVIMRLMCDLTLDVAEVERKFGVTFASYFAASLEKLAPLIADGLVTELPRRYDVTPAGRLFLRNIAMCF